MASSVLGLGSPGEQIDIHAWLVQRLEDERRDVLSRLEDQHRQLLADFLAVRQHSDILKGPAAPAGLDKTEKVDCLITESPPVAPERLVAVEDNEDLLGVAAEANRSVTVQQPTRGLKKSNSSPCISPANTDVNSGSNHKEHARTGRNKEASSEIEMERSGQHNNEATQHPIQRTSLVTLEDAEHETNGTTPMSRLDAFDESRLGQFFELFFGGVILANALVMAVSQQYKGIQRGYDLEYDEYDATKEDAWPHAGTVLEVFEVVFASLFTIEFIARFAVLRLEYLQHAWCYFDGIIIALAWLLVFLEDAVQVNPTFMRLARLTKLLRLLRLLRSNQMLDCLKLLVTAINASFSVLVWSVGVLLLVISICSLLMVQLLEPYFQESHAGDPHKLERQQEVFKYFGTFWRALITVFEATFANWAPSCRVLVEDVAEGYALFYFVYRCVIGLAVLMVVQAVFIQQTMKAAHLDDVSLARQQAKAKEKSLRRVERLFRLMDLNQDGVLEKHEFLQALKFADMRSMMEVFEIEVWDVDNLFNLLSYGDGSISLAEFVSHVQHLQGPARSIDVIEAKREVRKVRQFLMKDKVSM